MWSGFDTDRPRVTGAQEKSKQRSRSPWSGPFLGEWREVETGFHVTDTQSLFEKAGHRLGGDA